MQQHLHTRLSQQHLQQADAAAAEHQRIEVTAGALVIHERDMTFLHLLIIKNLYDLLSPFVQAQQLGTVFMDGGRYIIEGARDAIEKARIPDLAFVRAGRIGPDFDWSGDFVGAPDFVLEVASPGQGSGELLGRLADYFHSGTQEAWLVYPWRPQLFQYRHDDPAPRIYGADDAIQTAPLFTGSQLTLADLLRKNVI